MMVYMKQEQEDKWKDKWKRRWLILEIKKDGKTKAEMEIYIKISQSRNRDYCEKEDLGRCEFKNRQKKKLQVEETKKKE